MSNFSSSNVWTGSLKTMRMSLATNVIENGSMYLPVQAFWLEEYVSEVTTFPYSKYDDQVDSTSQALEFFKDHRMNPKVSWLDCLRVDDDSSSWMRIPSFGRP